MMKLMNMVRGTTTDIPARELLRNWEHDEGTLAFWRASSNFVYTFGFGGIKQFLRFIHEQDNSVDRITAELDFITMFSLTRMNRRTALSISTMRWFIGM